MSDGVRFDFMHFMPYPHLPENHKDYHSVWVDFPNKFYDPKKGTELYKRYLAELILAERVGFDAVVVNEHHNTAYSMMAAPNLIAAAIIPQMKEARICVWGTPPNLEYPNRLAEEYAMLDVMSEGRLEVAFPLGTGMEYWANPINPADARVKLMTNQVRCLFGAVPSELSSIIFASQATQGEALKYFIERFRAGKWRRTGMIWWNLMDGWPQFSDAIVDYYFNRKLAWHFVKLSQQHVAMMVREDQDGRPRLSAVNDTLVEVPLQYKVHDVQSGLELAGGTIQAKANSACDVCDLAGDKQGMYVIQWETPTGQGKNHYLAGKPPYALEQYRGWLAKSGLYPVARASCP